MPRPTWGQARSFCKRQGYDEISTDHHDYVKVIAGTVRSFTMVSHGSDAIQVPASMWKLVWSKQLHLKSEQDFWSGLNGGTVQYDTVRTAPQPEPLPAYLVHHLRVVHHYTPEQIAGITREQAQAMLNAYYSSTLAEPHET